MGRQRNAKRFVPKGIKFEGIAILTEVSTYVPLTGPQWERPKFTFQLPDGREVKWYSECNLASYLFNYAKGEGPQHIQIRIKGWIYGDRIKRLEPA